MKIAIATLVLVILAFSALITAAILQEIRLSKAENRVEKLANGFVAMEESFLRLHKAHGETEEQLVALNQDYRDLLQDFSEHAAAEEPRHKGLMQRVDRLEASMEELGDIARETMEAQRDADKAWANGVQEIMKFSVGK